MPSLRTREREPRGPRLSPFVRYRLFSFSVCCTFAFDHQRVSCELVRLPAQALVPGDGVRLEGGDRVPADGDLHDAHGAMVDEPILTGESVPIDKQDGDEAFGGTLLLRGKTFLQVTRTGSLSAMGRLATMLVDIETSKTPLERRVDALGDCPGDRTTDWDVGAVDEGRGTYENIQKFLRVLFSTDLSEVLLSRSPLICEIRPAAWCYRSRRRRSCGSTC